MEPDILKMALENLTLSPALEERSDGAALKEREFVFYARIKDGYEFPPTDNKERQEQWTIKIPQTDANAAKGDIRVRKTDLFDHGDLGQTEYVLTTKVRNGGEGDDEVPIPSSEDQFNHFKRLAESGMLKDRYTYDIPGTELKWEVDAFLKPGGGYHPWVKLDLEVPADAPRDFGIPEFPIEGEEWIKAQTGERLPAEEAKLRELYETMFLTKNPGAKSTMMVVDSSAGKDDIKDDQRPEATEKIDGAVPDGEVQGTKPATEGRQDRPQVKNLQDWFALREAGGVPTLEDWQAAWPELKGVPLHPDMVPSDEIYAPTEDGEVRSEPDESKLVVGVEEIQEFNSQVEKLARDMGVRLLHLSIGRGYLSKAELDTLAAAGEKSPKMIPIAQGGPYGSQYYFVNNPAQGSNIMGMGFQFTHPVICPDQVTF